MQFGWRAWRVWASPRVNLTVTSFGMITFITTPYPNVRSASSPRPSVWHSSSSSSQSILSCFNAAYIPIINSEGSRLQFTQASCRRRRFCLEHIERCVRDNRRRAGSGGRVTADVFGKEQQAWANSKWRHIYHQTPILTSVLAQVVVAAERGRDGRALNEPISDKEIIVDLMDVDRTQYYEQNFTTSKCDPYNQSYLSNYYKVQIVVTYIYLSTNRACKYLYLLTVLNVCMYILGGRHGHITKQRNTLQGMSDVEFGQTK